MGDFLCFAKSNQFFYPVKDNLVKFVLDGLSMRRVIDVCALLESVWLWTSLFGG